MSTSELETPKRGRPKKRTSNISLHNISNTKLEQGSQISVKSISNNSEVAEVADSEENVGDNAQKKKRGRPKKKVKQISNPTSSGPMKKRGRPSKSAGTTENIGNPRICSSKSTTREAREPSRRSARIRVCICIIYVVIYIIDVIMCAYAYLSMHIYPLY